MKYRAIISLSLVLAVLLTFASCASKKHTDNNVDSLSSDATDSKAINKADTSGMEFNFDEIDSSEIFESETVIDISKSTDQNSYKITTGGAYTFTGESNDVMLLVDADKEDVNITLSGVTINNSKGPAIYIRAAANVNINLEEDSTNTLTDGASYQITDNDSTLDAAVFSKADLTISGNGTLNINGNYKHGIISKDDLIISSGNLNVNSKNVGLGGKDCVKINNGNIKIDAGSDGIRSDNTEDTSKGYIYLSGGNIDITASNDGIQAQTVIKVENVNLNVKSGEGSSAGLTSSEESYKGLKAGSDIYITGGIFNIDSKDDSIHSNGTITVSGGEYNLSSGDDGIHADTDLEISGEATKLSISKSYEGIEATNLVITGGDISVVASDDGLNAAGGNNTSSDSFMMRPGKNNFSASTGSITISGGKIYIEMSGDGIDANGTLDITGGEITVSGANRGDTAILDFDSSGVISGGTFVATGASSMAQNFSSSSSQGVIFTTCNNQSANTKIALTDKNGNEIISYTARQDFSCVILSHSAIKQGESYTLTVGNDEIEITMTDTVYGSGTSGGFGGVQGGMGGGMRPF